MNADRTAPTGSIVYQVSIDGMADRIVRDYRAAMEVVGFEVAGSLEVLNSWKLVSEFPNLDTPDLTGSYLHRIRYALLQSGRDVADFKITEHRISDMVAGKTAIRTIYPGNEFDPGFEMQLGLYRVAEGKLTPAEASSAMKSTIEHHISRFWEKLRDSDGMVVDHLYDVYSRMGGPNFLENVGPDKAVFLDWLPDKVGDHFNELAQKAFPVQEAFPAKGMTP